MEVRVSPEGESVETIDERSVSGTVNENATALGDRALADDVQILDTSTGGVAGTVRPSRLSGVNLKASDVRYYTTNPQGQIDKLILNDVTGDLWYYGVLDDVKNVAANYSTLLSAIKAQPGDGTIDTDAVVSQVKGSIMVPTTTYAWGVISGDILSTAWERLTSTTGALLGLGFNRSPRSPRHSLHFRVARPGCGGKAHPSVDDVPTTGATASACARRLCWMPVRRACSLWRWPRWVSAAGGQHNDQPENEEI